MWWNDQLVTGSKLPCLSASLSCCCDITFSRFLSSFPNLLSSLESPYPRSFGSQDMNCFLTGTAGKLAKGSDGRLWYSSRNVFVFRWLFWNERNSIDAVPHCKPKIDDKRLSTMIFFFGLFHEKKVFTVWIIIKLLIISILWWFQLIC